MEKRLSKIDLNLLLAFYVLMEERSVTKAADRLFITQPAMSRTLQRLREQFNDPLLVRTNKGLAPTSKAEQLVEPIRGILERLNSVLLDQPFNPMKVVRNVRLLLPDSLSIAVIPKLYLQLQIEAPGIRLQTEDAPLEHLKLLASGECDFSINIDQKCDADIEKFPLDNCPAVCWMRKGHPLQEKNPMMMSDLVQHPSLLVQSSTQHSQSLQGLSSKFVEIHKAYGIFERARLMTTQLLTAIAIIRSSDTVMIGAPYLEQLDPVGLDIMYKPIQELEDVTALLVLYQHKRTSNSPLHCWLREQIIRAWG